MSISVEGQKCPVCHGYLFDDEELVFCPVCGAPHHRECYFKINHCAMEQFHGTEMEYHRPDPVEQPKENPTPEQEAHTHEADKACPNCGFSLPEDANFCPNCNRPVDAAPVGGMPFISMLPSDYDPYGGVKKEEETDGVKAEEMRNYIAVNTARYIPKFFTLHKTAKTSWNWAAFLFPSAWFFYRKIYNVGVIAFAFSVCTSLLTLSTNVLMMQIENSGTDLSKLTLFQQSQAMLQYAQQHSMLPIYLIFASVIASIIYRIIFGLFGDWFYRKSALTRTQKVKGSDGVEDLPQSLRLKGGVNPILAMFAFMAASWIPSILYQIIYL